jgi:hypothetical protein
MQQKRKGLVNTASKCFHLCKRKVIMNAIIVLWYVLLCSSCIHVLTLSSFICFLTLSQHKKERNQLVPLRDVEINTTINAATQRHQHVRKPLQGEGLLALLDLHSTWLGSNEAALCGQRVGQLSVASVSSYSSNIRRFFIWLEVGVYPHYCCFVITAFLIKLLLPSQDTTALDGEEAISAIVQSAAVLKNYITCLVESHYTLKTQLNHMLALQRLLSWIEYRVNTRQWNELHKKKNVKNLLQERSKWLAAQIKVTKTPAETETIARNDRQALEKQGKWATFEELLQVRLLDICIVIVG